MLGGLTQLVRETIAVRYSESQSPPPSQERREMKEIEKVHFEYVLSDKPKPCFVCGRQTCYVEINYAGHLCSDRCDKQIGEDLKRRAKKGGRDENTS